MSRLFGTDGVRGIANSELTCELAFKLGQAGAFVLAQQSGHKAKILVGKDTRISSDMLEAAICAGICSVGAQAITVGVVPTPTVAFLTGKFDADAGVVISASHNSMEYNGIKFFNGSGFKLSDEIEDQIEAVINKGIKNLPVGDGLGRITQNFDAKNEYIKFSKSTIKTRLDGLKIAIDCANGASYEIAKEVFSGLGADVFAINNSPDGLNINKDCGSTHIKGLQMFTTKCGADIGLAFDGDADRVLAVDESGNIVDGDKIMMICALDMKNKGMLKKNTIVATIMSNLGLFIAAKKHGINVEQTKVGDRYVLEEMLGKGYCIGGEQSGHIIFLDYNTTGDGLLTALQLLSVMKTTGKKLSSLSSVMQQLPQVLVNAKVKGNNKEDYLKDPDIKKEIDNIEKIFSGQGRVLIRPSGTEPLVRVMIEGPDIDFITEKAKHLAALIEKKIS